MKRQPTAEGEAIASVTELNPSDVTDRTSLRNLLTGGAVLAVAMTLANAGNYLLSLTLGRWLGAERFADANLMVTLMLLITAVAVGLQLVMARVASEHEAEGRSADSAGVAARLARRASIVGVVAGVALAAGSGLWASWLNVADPINFVILGVGMPAYLVQAVDRGLLQGRLQFVELAITFVVEMVVRVGLAIGLVAAGLGVPGATIGLTVSFICTWAVARWRSGRDASASQTISPSDKASVAAIAGPAAVLLFGQILVNNGDVVIAKSSLDGLDAGTYAAVALFGRAVFFLSWSVVTTLFPASAQREAAGESSDRLLLGGVGIVGVVTAALVGLAAVAGDSGLPVLLGPDYADLGNLLVGYGIATGMFAIANLVATQQLAKGRTVESWIIVAGGVLQTVLLVLWRQEAATLVRAQLVAMGLLAVTTGISVWISTRRTHQSTIGSTDATTETTDRSNVEPVAVTQEAA